MCGQVSLTTAQEVAVASSATVPNHHLVVRGSKTLTSVGPQHLLLEKRGPSLSSSPAPGQTKQEAHVVKTSAAVDISWEQKSNVRGAVKTSGLYLLSSAPCTSCSTSPANRSLAQIVNLRLWVDHRLIFYHSIKGDTKFHLIQNSFVVVDAVFAEALWCDSMFAVMF